MSEVLNVLLYNEPIGTLMHLPGDKNLFTFERTYVNNSSRPILSLSFKDVTGNLIQDIEITRTRLPPFFANLLPEGAMREYLAKRAGVHSEHEFSLLEILGQDLPGAITIQAADQNKVSALKSRSDDKKKRTTPFRFSLAGIQMKFSAIKKGNFRLSIPEKGIGGNWIIKLPHSTFKNVPENEYSMMELARKVGIDVPETALHSIEEVQGLPKEFEHLGDKVFAIKRFDRVSNGEKIHIEDFAQVFGVYPEKKYKNASYRNIAEVIWKEIGEKGIVEFIRRFVFCALIGNGDMHLKNWSLIYTQKTKTGLAPAYDFVSTILYLPEDELALKFVDSRDFQSLTIDQFKRFVAKAGLPEKLILDTVEDTVQSFAANWETVQDLPLTKEVKMAIVKHIKNIPFWKHYKHNID